MRNGPGLLAVLLVLALATPPAPAGAPEAAASGEPRPPVSATLADVSFLSGRWLSGEAETFSEETWSPPAGDSMVGTWRLAAKGRARVFELLTLLAEEGKVVLRLRHFDRHGVAWEEKDAPLVLPLVAKGDGLAVFEGREGATLLRLTYRSEAAGLVVSLEKEAGAPQVYRFRRAAQE